MEQDNELREREMIGDTEIESIEPEEVESAEAEVVQENIGPEPEEGKDWRDSVYGNIKMSVKTLDLIIGAMVGFIILVLLVGAIKNFL